MSISIEERLCMLEDREAIHSLLMKYVLHLDAHDVAAYSRLFARDGEWSGGLGHARGPEGIRALLEDRILPLESGQVPDVYHLVVNETINLEGDHATARSVFVAISRSKDDRPTIRSQGHYEDELIREYGEWRFRSRKTLTDIPAVRVVHDDQHSS